MNRPDYFLVDLPAEAVITPDLITQAAQTLKLNRERYLSQRTTVSLVKTFCQLAQSWLEPEFPFRVEALQLGPAAAGIPAATLARGLDDFFGRFTTGDFAAWLEQEFGQADRLDTLGASRPEQRGQRRSMAQGPELIAWMPAAEPPIGPLMNLVEGFLVRSAQFIQCPKPAVFLARLFAHSLYEVEPKLGACLEIASWGDGRPELEDALWAETDAVAANGSAPKLEAIRGRLPGKVRFFGDEERVSFGFITCQALQSLAGLEIVENAVADIVPWNQAGPLAPQVFYVERGAGSAGEVFAEQLAGALAKWESQHPRGPLLAPTAAAIATRRSLYAIRAAHSPDTRCWFSQGSDAWSVVYEADPRFQVSCRQRFIYVKGVADLTEALQGADAFRHRISSVGLAATEAQAQDLARQLAAWGTPRICPLGRMQNPNLAGRRDGQPTLARLVHWTDWEL
jgi:hypothetical protein